VRQALVGGVARIAAALRSALIAEGVETRAEYRALHSPSVVLFQAYLFGRPQLGALAPVPDALWETLD